MVPEKRRDRESRRRPTGTEGGRARGRESHGYLGVWTRPGKGRTQKGGALFLCLKVK